jgi:hypothetical protein
MKNKDLNIVTWIELYEFIYGQLGNARCPVMTKNLSQVKIWVDYKTHLTLAY